MSIWDWLFGRNREQETFRDRIPVRTGEYGSQSVRIYDILMDREVEAEMDAFHEAVSLDIKRREEMKKDQQRLAVSQ